MHVKVEGLARLVNQLEKFSPEVSKALKSEMRKGAGIVASEAKSLIPNSGLSNWGAWSDSGTGRDLGFIGSWVKKGITPKTNRYRRRGVTTAFGYDVVSSTAAGAIYEVAGPGNKTRDARGQGFVRNLNRSRNEAPLPRTLFPAYYEGMSRAVPAIEAAIREAERKVGR
jgi:hypothetical protein